MNRFKKLHFKPFMGLYSKHLQMILSSYAHPGEAPSSERWMVSLGNGDQLSCEMSTPSNWNHKIVPLFHGLGGSQDSNYMIRMTRKFYERGYKVVRVNFRGCGSGKGLSKKPYCAGCSDDILCVLQQLKVEYPQSEIYPIGFSLGGNALLKLAGELGEKANKLVKRFIAVCPPLDLEQTVQAIQKWSHTLYHQYYLKGILNQCHHWTTDKFSSIYEFDDKITGPAWGFSGAKEYYQKCSSAGFLDKIKCETHIMLAEDDPFVSMECLKGIQLPDNVHVWTSTYGSHMGFLGQREFQWMDQQLVNWVEGDFDGRWGQDMD